MMELHLRNLTATGIDFTTWNSAPDHGRYAGEYMAENRRVFENLVEDQP